MPEMSGVAHDVLADGYVYAPCMAVGVAKPLVSAHGGICLVVGMPWARS